MGMACSKEEIGVSFHHIPYSTRGTGSMKFEDAILPKGPLFGLLVIVGLVIGAEKWVSFMIDDTTTANPRVECLGVGIDTSHTDEVHLDLKCGSKSTFSAKPRVIARFIATPNEPIICKLRKSGNIACDK
jgi:hypothetical protein